MTALVPSPSGFPQAPGIPAKLNVNESWSGRVYYSDEISEARDKGQLYVGVIGTHSRRTYLKRVPRKKTDLPKKEV